MPSYEKDVREKLDENGCYFKRHGKGDHDIWYSPKNQHSFPVDGEIKSRHMANGWKRSRSSRCLVRSNPE
jgi:hypothetical protein